MGNVNLPTPVAAAGGALCVLAGYLLGVVAGPSTPAQTTAAVESYDADSGELCLTGDGVGELAGGDGEGPLCGLWRRTEGSRTEPRPGDTFRFVSVRVDQAPAGEAASGPATMIYGDVVR